MNLGWDKEKIEEFINNDKPVVIIDEEYFKENYISKDKIKDKIKELEEIWERYQEEHGYNDENYMYYMAQIKVLKEMLGEL